MTIDDSWSRGPGGGGPGGLDPESRRKLTAWGFRLLLGIPLLLIVLAGVLTLVYQIEPEKRGVVLRFGKFHKVSEPGLHFKIPYGVDRVTLVDAPQRVLKEEFGFRTAEAGQRTTYSDRDFSDESLMLTGDLNIIQVEWVVQYSVQDPQQYLFNIRDPRETLRDTSEAVMRRIVGNRLASNVLTRGRVDIASSARDEIQSIMDSYESGLRISTVEMQDVVPPRNVQPAFNEVNVSRQERERMINEAEKRRNQQIPRVQGEAQQLIAEAEGYATERVNQAKGETARFSAILEEYTQAPDVTRQRLYLEMIGAVLPNVERIVVLPEDNANQPLPLLNLNERSSALQGGSSK